MEKQAILERTIEAIRRLPKEKAEEISDFADFVLSKYEDQTLTEGIQQLVSESSSFQFLKDEEDLYSVSDLKERFHE
ncbi:MAG: hypothetical protein EPN37_02025 [Chitinophagaceae bacterium]|nr:MAG: hypothetical protein EPN37_02025 [Chitinophagaceae bacterium]